MTGHTEAVLVVFDPPGRVSISCFKIFWENHDPTQYMGQGNDIGTQYRSAIYTTTDEQLAAALPVATPTRQARPRAASARSPPRSPGGEFYYAEDYHQQYLAKNPGGYCNHGFCQVAYAATPA